MLEIEIFWYLNCVPILNRIVWNRTVFDIETALKLNWIVWNGQKMDMNYIYRFDEKMLAGQKIIKTRYFLYLHIK